MNRSLIALLIIAVIYSCRKDNNAGDELLGDKTFFVGEWELIGSHHWNQCGSIDIEYLSADEQELDYRVVFEERGYVTFYENEKAIEGGYIRFPAGGFEAKKVGTFLDPKHIEFVIWLDGDRDRHFSGSGMIDSIRTNSLPRTGFLPFPDDCDVFISYLKRK